MYLRPPLQPKAPTAVIRELVVASRMPASQQVKAMKGASFRGGSAGPVAMSGCFGGLIG